MSELLTQGNVKTFGMHQTFTPRLRWLAKAFGAVQDDPYIFSKPSAPSVLGVGKNMVTAMAHWSQAFKIIRPSRTEEIADKTTETRRGFSVTNFGRFLLDSDDGVDPFLERTESIWFLHWALLREECRVPIWWITFNSFRQSSFTGVDFDSYCARLLANSDWRYQNSAMVSRDSDCMFRMYSDRQVARRSMGLEVTEEPFRDLGLIHYDAAKKIYRFNWGDKAHLTSLLIAYFVLDEIDRIKSPQRTWSISALSDGACSLSHKLLANGNRIVEALVEVSRLTKIQVVFPAGVPQLVISQSPRSLKQKVLQLLYPETNRLLLQSDLFGDNPNVNDQHAVESRVAVISTKNHRSTAAERTRNKGRPR